MDQIYYEAGILAQCVAAMILGGIIGWEREQAGKWAGIRTQMLICISTTLFVRMGELLLIVGNGAGSVDSIRSDPIRIIEAIVTGIAFIGAGTVFRDRHRNTAHGLTTAASMLTVIPIGIAVALNRYFLAVGITFIAWFVLRVVGLMENKLGIAPRHLPDDKERSK